MNPYQALMQAGQQQQMQPKPQVPGGMPGAPQGIPVHHEGNPQYQRLEEAITEIDGALEGLALGDPTYDDLIRMKQTLMQKRANIGAAHDQLVGRKRGYDIQNKYGTIVTDPRLEGLERGVIPGGK